MKLDEWQKQQKDNKQNSSCYSTSCKKIDSKTQCVRNCSNDISQKTITVDVNRLDIIEKAEEVIKKLIRSDRYGNKKIFLTTSQIRKFLTAVNVVKNKVDIYKMQPDNDYLSDELALEIQFLKVSILYQSGRENAVKEFVEESDIVKIISGIENDIKKFERFHKYIEALVAYHKYYGGKDK